MDNDNNDNINSNINNKKEDKETGNIYQEILNKLNNSKTNNHNDNNDDSNTKKFEKNFSQQVDFLYHKNNPEGQSSIKNIIIKQYKKQTKLEKEKKRKKNKSLSPKKLIPYANKNKGLFDPYLSQKELDYESNIEKQRAERQKKIDEYEKNINKKKLKKNLDKKILNLSKPNIMQAKIKKNYAKDKNKRELIQNIIQMPKPKIKKNYTKSFGFQPKKYDMIINSLMEQINQGEKNNKKVNIENKIKNYAKNNIDQYNNYYEYIYKNNINNVNEKRNEIMNNNTPKPTRAQIIKGLMQKYFGNNENNKQNTPNKNNINKKNKNKNKEIIMKSNKKKIKDKENSDDNILLNIETDIKNNNEINFDNIDKLLASNKINIISELNKNIDKYSQAMPLIINQVQNSLNEIYKNNKNDFNFRNKINKIPYLAMASKTAYQIIQTNNDSIIEKIIEELIYEFAFEIQNIKNKKEYLMKKQKLIDEFNITKNKIDDITQNEKNILDENLKLIEEKKNNEENIINKKEENKIIIKKYKANLDEDLIKRNDQYKNDFKEYMTFKGSFYADNIFNIYDEFIEEESNIILNKIVDNFIGQLNK